VNRAGVRQAAASMNAGKVARLLENWAGSAVLYRTRHAGPSGQRADLAVGRIRYCWEETGWELEVADPRTGEVVGYLSRDSWCHQGMWIVQSHCEDFSDYQFNRLLGWASSAAVGADVLVNGINAATGRHDSQRISGTFTQHDPEMGRRAA
jgi:hypothetical protein